MSLARSGAGAELLSGGSVHARVSWLEHTWSMGTADQALIASAVSDHWELHVKHYLMFCGQVHA